MVWGAITYVLPKTSGYITKHSIDELDRKRSKSDRTILFRSDFQSLFTLETKSLFDLIFNLFFCDLDRKKIEFSRSFFALEISNFFHF